MLTLLFAIVIATVVHELGHVVGALAVGAEIRDWGVRIWGPYLRVQIDPPSRWRASMQLLAGPAANLLLAWGARYVWLELGAASAALAFFNLTFPGSDGWQSWSCWHGDTVRAAQLEDDLHAAALELRAREDE